MFYQSVTQATQKKISEFSQQELNLWRLGHMIKLKKKLFRDFQRNVSKEI